MKTRAFFSAMALLSTTSMISSQALAVVTGTPTVPGADSTTLAGMTAQCAAQALVYGQPTGDNDHYTAAVVAGGPGALTSGPTENGTRSVDQNSITPTGTYVPSVKEIRGNPYKVGGSVNMFGDQWSTKGYYPGSTYTYTANFDETYTFSFGCDISKAVYHPAVYHPEVYHPAVFHPAEGSYVVRPSEHGNDDAQQQACDALNGIGNTWPHWGEETQQCHFNQTAAAYTTPAFTDPAYTDPAYWDTAVVIASNVAGTPITQNQSETLAGFEPNGPMVTVTGEHFDGQVVICISPGSKGGAWKVQNGYGGGSTVGPAAGCNTPYFKIAPTNSGSTTSQGTFTSVPQYSL